ncbi:MAG: lysophospholipid acyltransferase family protein [Aquincola sp.]|nr:lysophospholipid acyltransferase family protein [Aquincola sp.]MDH4287199.1 lysophospholipid acyltransferase family protein [Aquincola sp.]MDH5328629.1 lysophospholipid acyltransferase family protein [Aquincola sp.]
MLTVLYWLSRRSLGFLHALGSLLGWAGYALSPSYRTRFNANADRAGLSREHRRAAIAHAGRMVTETPRLWLRSADAPLTPKVEWVDAHLIDAALEAGRGIVILTPHLGAFEVTAQAYAERFGARQPVTALYRPAKKAWLRELEASARARPGMLTAPASLAGVRQMIRALRQGQTVGLLPDQVPPEGMGVWAPFFGQDAYTMTLAARLSLQTGAPLLLMIGERLGAATGWRMRVFAMPEPLPEAPAFGGDDMAHQIACATAINRAMEFLIRQCPQQYLWGYHRYKNPRTA